MQVFPRRQLQTEGCEARGWLEMAVSAEPVFHFFFFFLCACSPPAAPPPSRAQPVIVMGGDSSPLPSVPTVLRALDPPYTPPTKAHHHHPKSRKATKVTPYVGLGRLMNLLFSPINPRICISLLAISLIILFCLAILLYVYGFYWSDSVGALCGHIIDNWGSCHHPLSLLLR